MTTWSIFSVKFIFVVLVFSKTMYFDFFKFNDNLFIFSHSFILANSVFIFVSVSLMILFSFDELILL